MLIKPEVSYVDHLPLLLLMWEKVGIGDSRLSCDHSPVTERAVRLETSIVESLGAISKLQ